MKTFIIFLAGATIGSITSYFCTQYKDKLKELIKGLRGPIVSPKTPMRKVDLISMRTFGDWIKEHDMPSFSSYKFIILKGQNLIDEKLNKENLNVYVFCITDAKSNIIDSCIYLCDKIDATFASKVTNKVNEIVIQ